MNTLPAQLGPDVRSLRRESDLNGSLDDHAIVLAKTKKIVEDTHSPSVKSTVDDALSVVASILTDRPLAVPSKAEGGGNIGDASGGYAKLVAFLQERGVNLTVLKASGRAKKQARKAAAALAAALTLDSVARVHLILDSPTIPTP